MTLDFPNSTTSDPLSPPMRYRDGSIIYNDKGNVVYRSQFLSTHPLRKDCKERMGYGGVKLTYLTGESAIRTMNAAFGHTGWGTEITMERQVHCERDPKGRWVVGFIATVRVTVYQQGAFGNVTHEDCGSGEGMNESKMRAVELAFKSAITDAMKRAARHFGDRLGNALYVKGNGIHTAPVDNKTALRNLEQAESLEWFGHATTQRQETNPLPDTKHEENIPCHSPPDSATAATTTLISGETRVSLPTHGTSTINSNTPARTVQVTVPPLAYSTPIQGAPRGFTRASQLVDTATIVTPLNSSRQPFETTTSEPTTNREEFLGGRNSRSISTSPNAIRGGYESRQMPRRPRYNPGEGTSNQSSSPRKEREENVTNPTKRPRLANNPYRQ